MPAIIPIPALSDNYAALLREGVHGHSAQVEDGIR
jgi:hypothetical protein